MEKSNEEEKNRKEEKENKEVQEKLQWHHGFMSAFELDYKSCWDGLEFIRDYPLNKGTLEIDLLVIKKDGYKVTDKIGKIFRKFNIIEFKSIEDSFSEDVLYKVMAYTFLYKSYEEHRNERPLDEMTITIMREAKPEELIDYLEKHHFMVEEEDGGIYHVKDMDVPVQLVVTKELDTEVYRWLHMLTTRVSEQEMRDAILYWKEVEKSGNKREKDLVDSVMNLSIEANSEVVNRLIKREKSMLELFSDMFQPMIQEEAKKQSEEEKQRADFAEKRADFAEKRAEFAEQRVEFEKQRAERAEQENKKMKEDNVRMTVNTMRSIHFSEEIIRKFLKVNWGFSEEEASGYLSD